MLFYFYLLVLVWNWYESFNTIFKSCAYDFNIFLYLGISFTVILCLAACVWKVQQYKQCHFSYKVIEHQCHSLLECDFTSIVCISISISNVAFHIKLLSISVTAFWNVTLHPLFVCMYQFSSNSRKLTFRWSYLWNFQLLWLSNFAQAVILLTYIQEAFILCLGWNTTYPNWSFFILSSFPLDKCLVLG